MHDVNVSLFSQKNKFVKLEGISFVQIFGWCFLARVSDPLATRVGQRSILPYWYMGQFGPISDRRIMNSTFAPTMAPGPEIEGEYCEGEFVRTFSYSDQWKALVIIAKVSGIFSIFGSGAIIKDILHKPSRTQNLDKIRNRILLLFSFGDLSHTFFGHILGTWMAPKGCAYGSAGTLATCMAQGCLTLFSASLTISLNATLAISYVLVVTFGWKEDGLRRLPANIFFFGIPIAVALVFSIWGLVDVAFNFGGGWLCFVDSWPIGCRDNDDVPCVRGLNALRIEFTYMVANVWTAVVIVFIACLILWWTVLQKERQSDRFSFSGDTNRTLSNRIAMQGIYYSGCFFLTYLFWYMMVFCRFAGVAVPYWMLLAHVIIVPAQGVLNAFVYFRPRWVAQREEAAAKRREKKEKEEADGAEREALADSTDLRGAGSTKMVTNDVVGKDRSRKETNETYETNDTDTNRPADDGDNTLPAEENKQVEEKLDAGETEQKA